MHLNIKDDQLLLVKKETNEILLAIRAGVIVENVPVEMREPHSSAEVVLCFYCSSLKMEEYESKDANAIIYAIPLLLDTENYDTIWQDDAGIFNPVESISKMLASGLRVLDKYESEKEVDETSNKIIKGVSFSIGGTTGKHRQAFYTEAVKAFKNNREAINGVIYLWKSTMDLYRVTPKVDEVFH